MRFEDFQCCLSAAPPFSDRIPILALESTPSATPKRDVCAFDFQTSGLGCVQDRQIEPISGRSNPAASGRCRP